MIILSAALGARVAITASSNTSRATAVSQSAESAAAQGAATQAETASVDIETLATYPDQTKQHARTVQEERGTLFAPDAKVAAITLDDGPDPDCTPAILDTLREKGIKATFFVVGKSAQAYPDLIQRMVEEGHVVSNHSWSHADLRKVSSSEFSNQIDRTNALIREMTGHDTPCVRAPGGDVDDSVISAISKRGQTTMRWDTSTGDFLRKGVQYQIDAVMERLHPGSVILMHDGGGDRSQTVEALPQIIDKVRAKGYEFTTVCAPK